MLPLRSLLFVPGNRSDMLAKAKGMVPDAIVPDMEDSVPPGKEKSHARDTIASHLQELTEAGHLVIPRTNALPTGLMEKDLKAVIGPHIFGVTVGKISSSKDISKISNIIEKLEKEAGLPPNKIKLIPWLETAKGIVNAYEICLNPPRVIAAAFGAEDLTNDMGIERTTQGSELSYARHAICLAARAANILPLDTPFPSFRDPIGLRQDSLTARAIGFAGKFAIHPSQINTINEAFIATQTEIEQAQRIVEAYEIAEKSGRATTSLDGIMIDVPVVKRARKLIEEASIAMEIQG